MSKIDDVAALVEKGKAKLVGKAVQEALDAGCEPIEILNKGMIDAMELSVRSSKTARSSFRRCW